MNKHEMTGRALKVFRIERGLTIATAAERAGVSVDSLGRWEREDSMPNIRQLDAILAAYGKDLGDFNAARGRLAT